MPLVNMAALVTALALLSQTFASRTSPSFLSSRLNTRQNAGYVPAGPFLGDFPDPGLIRLNDTWYAYSTSTLVPDVNVPIATSPDLISWNRVTDPATGNEVDAMPTLPNWVNMSSPQEWAPDVAEWRPGVYTMLYSAVPMTSYRQHCIGVAQASSPFGPFISYSADPLICPLAEGGAIDASHFRDPETGLFYVAYKVDGGSLNAGSDGSLCGNTATSPRSATPIVLQQIGDPQYFNLVGGPITLLDNNGASDEGDIEAPSLLYVPPNNGGGNVKRNTGDVIVEQVDTSTETVPCTTDKPQPTSTASSSTAYSYTPSSSAVTSATSSQPSFSSSSSLSSATSSQPSSSPSSSSSPSPSSSPSSSPSPSPSPVPQHGTYILAFSPGCFADPSYSIGYAVSTSGVAGPYIRHPGNLLMTGDGGLLSPGGMTITGTDPVLREALYSGSTSAPTAFAYAVYHAGIPYPNGTRDLYSTLVNWDGTSLALQAP